MTTPLQAALKAVQTEAAKQTQNKEIKGNN